MTDEQAEKAFRVLYKFLDRYGLKEDEHRFDWHVIHDLFVNFWTGRSNRMESWYVACGEIRKIFLRRPGLGLDEDYLRVEDARNGFLHCELTEELNALIKAVID